MRPRPVLADRSSPPLPATSRSARFARLPCGRAGLPCGRPDGPCDPSGRLATALRPPVPRPLRADQMMAGRGTVTQGDLSTSFATILRVIHDPSTDGQDGTCTTRARRARGVPGRPSAGRRPSGPASPPPEWACLTVPKSDPRERQANRRMKPQTGHVATPVLGSSTRWVVQPFVAQYRRESAATRRRRRRLPAAPAATARGPPGRRAKDVRAITSFLSGLGARRRAPE
jgi:hypothetical protein